MPLEVEICAVPHLKGLINAENIPSRQERGSSFEFLSFLQLTQCLQKFCGDCKVLSVFEKNHRET